MAGTPLFFGGNTYLADVLIDLDLFSVYSCLFRHSDINVSIEMAGTVRRGGLSSHARLRRQRALWSSARAIADHPRIANASQNLKFEIELAGDRRIFFNVD